MFLLLVYLSMCIPLSLRFSITHERDINDDFLRRDCVHYSVFYLIFLKFENDVGRQFGESSWGQREFRQGRPISRCKVNQRNSENNQ